uniref:DUF3047 domain-containing protein n=1 Tax=Polynucleobacter sp. TaxID=2029855 RepID=UPI0040472F0D
MKFNIFLKRLPLKSFKQLGFIFAGIFFLSSCATIDVTENNVPPPENVEQFSILNEGDKLPKAWQIWRVTPQKNKTQYTLKNYQGRTVLHASADVAASGLVLPLKPRPAAQQVLSWEWKAMNLIADADNQESSKDDAPLRIVVAFDGDKTKLPLKDQMSFEMAKIISGHDMPYASLMYVWSSKNPLETVIPSPRTSRIKMIVVNSGSDQLGVWQKHQRDLSHDYQSAFNSPPGKIIGLGLMTDSDNTKSKVTAIYGDIELKKVSAKNED